MFAYQLVLSHPDHRQEIALRLISDWHFATVTELLRREGLAHTYRDWSILSFQTVPLCAEAAARARRWRGGGRVRTARRRPSPASAGASARSTLGRIVDTKV